jgi:hypothetical protein
MATKSQQLQIRVTPREKTVVKRLAAAAGLDVSAYVLSRAVPAHRVRFEELLREMVDAGRHGRSYVLAELNNLLTQLTRAELREAVEHGDVSTLPAYERNYVAAMVEQACHFKGAAPPSWTAEVTPLDEPRFATPLKSLRPHLLRASPVPFRRRNIFIDSSIGDRV